MRTFGEKHADEEAEVDRGNGIDEQEHKQNGPGGMTYDAPVPAHPDREQDRHQHNGYEEEQQVLDKPGHPVQPATQSHHLHSLLKKRMKFLILYV